MNNFPLYDHLLHDSNSGKNANNEISAAIEARRIESAIENLNEIDQSNLKEIIYVIICHHDFISNGKSTRYASVPYNGTTFKDPSTGLDGIKYQKISNFPIELLKVIRALMDIVHEAE